MGKKKKKFRASRHTINPTGLWLEKTIDYGLPLLTAAIILSLSLSTADTFALPKFVILLGGAVLLFSFWLIHASLQAEVQISRTRIDLPILLFFLVSLASTLFSANRAMSLMGSYERFDGLLSILAYTLVFFLSVQVFRKGKDRLDFALKTVMFATFFVSVYGLMQYFGLDLIPWPEEGFESNRSFATLGNPVLLGSFLTMMLPIILALMLTRENSTQAAWYGLCFLLAGASLATTFSRGAWIAAAVSLVIFALMAGKRLSQSQKRKGFISVLMLAVTSAIIALLSLGSGEGTNIVKRLASLLHLGGESGISRLEIWKSSLQMIAERPMLGFGPDTFRSVFSRYETIDFIKIGGYDQTADNAHNYLLQLASTTGILGLLVFIFTVTLLLWYGLKLAKVRTGGDSLVYAGLTAGLSGYLISLFFGINSHAGMVVFLMIAGAIASGSSRLRVTKFKWPSAVWKNVTITVAAALAVVVIGLSARLYVADKHVGTAHYLLDMGYIASAIQEYERATLLNPYIDYYHSVLGEALLILAEETNDPDTLEESIAALIKAKHINPLEFDNYILLADAYMYGGRMIDPAYSDQAIGELQSATAVKKYPALSHYFLGRTYSEKGDVSLALHHLNKSLEIDPNFTPARNLVEKLSEAKQAN